LSDVTSGGFVRTEARWCGSPHASVRFHVPLLATALAVLVSPRGLGAQQFVTDDAAITDARSCQVEAWHGESASWVLPACNPFSGMEFTAGVGFVGTGDGRQTEYVLQAKSLLRETEPGRPGIGLVAGLGIGRIGQISGRAVSGAFAYVPVTALLTGDRLIAHANAGWQYEREEHDHGGDSHRVGHHGFGWALRADAGLSPRFTALGELFGQNGGRPEFQVGLRSIALVDRLAIDVSWGGQLESGAAGAGWAVGFAWTPNAVF